ncbi:hypothetical protein J6590_100920 [Homalodisca vitripennis]|nr:hypothetical protein J6590_100920 [Homalodisca vitripennis]
MMLCSGSDTGASIACATLDFHSISVEIVDRHMRERCCDIQGSRSLVQKLSDGDSAN